MEKISSIEEGIRNKDKQMLREILGNICYSDSGFMTGVFDEQLAHIQQHINIKDDKLTGELSSTGKTEFTEEDFVTAVFDMKENFCDERINEVKKVGKWIKAHEQKSKQEQLAAPTNGTIPNPLSHRGKKNKSAAVPVAVAAAVIVVLIFIIIALW